MAGPALSVAHNPRMDESGQGARPAHGEREADAEAESLLRKAADLFRTGHIRSGAETAIRAADLARKARRTDLLAKAALVVSGVQDPLLDTALEATCRDALAAIDERDVAMRARLHGQLAVVLFHRGHIDQAATHSERALALGAQSDEPAVRAATLHARQMLTEALFRPAELVALGDQMLDLALRSRSTTDAMLGHVWRIHGYVQLGRPQRAAEEIDSLDVLATRSDEPLVAWHALRSRAGFYQAVGRLDEAERFALLARERVLPEQASFLLPQYFAQRVMIALDRGQRPAEADTIASLSAGGPPIIRATHGHLELVCGNIAAARASFEATKPRLGDVRDETRFGTLASMVVLAVALDDLETAEQIHRELAPFDGLVIGGAIAVVGPVGYFLALVDARAGRIDEAIGRLEAAAALSARGDLGPSLARIRVALAETLLRRSAAGDRDRAAVLASIAAADAQRLGLTHVRAQALALEARLAKSALQLSPREREIAVQVAAGRSNREIAAGLVVSERTVETHVQNILTKLEFHGRAQIAAWAVGAGLLKDGT